MSPAERKFSRIEGGLSRAQCLVRALRELCEGGHDNIDAVLWGGIYIIVGEAETAIDEAHAFWSEAHKLAAGR